MESSTSEFRYKTPNSSSHCHENSHHSSFTLAACGSHTYYFSDGMGNIIMMLDANENVVAEYRYDSFGRLLDSSGTLADANLYRFSSKEWHPRSGFYYYLYRYYDPVTQRWINQDPIGEDGGLNLFGFVMNSPSSHIDFWGLQFTNAELLAEYGCGIDNTFTNPETGETRTGTGVLGEIPKELGQQAVTYGATRGAGKAVGPLKRFGRWLKGLFKGKGDDVAKVPLKATDKQIGKNLVNICYPTDLDTELIKNTAEEQRKS